MGYKDDAGFADFVVDQMQRLGPVRPRRMFGGFGLFLDGLMIGLIARHTLYFKVDDLSRSRFERLGLQAFDFERQGKRVALSFYEAPEDVLEEAEAMAEWGGEAYAAACRSARKKSAGGN